LSAACGRDGEPHRARDGHVGPAADAAARTGGAEPHLSPYVAHPCEPALPRHPGAMGRMCASCGDPDHLAENRLRRSPSCIHRVAPTLQCLSSYGAPRVKPYCQIFRNNGLQPTSGRTANAPIFRSACEPPFDAVTNLMEYQLHSYKSVEYRIERLPADRVSRKAQGWRLREECGQLGSQQAPIRDRPAWGAPTQFSIRLATP
jgi:hypothetical protein